VTGEVYDTFESVAFVVNWSPDGKSIITWSQEDGNVLLINVETKETLLSLPIDDQRPTHFEWSPDGETIAVSTGIKIVEDLGRTYLFDAQTGEAIKSLSVPDDDPAPWARQPSEFPMTGFAWLDDQTIAISTGAASNEVFFSHFSMGDYGGSIMIWDVQTGEMLLELDGHNGEVQDIALSPDGSTLASASADGTVILWDVAQIMAMIED
jgi:WD40 repeat protein